MPTESNDLARTSKAVLVGSTMIALAILAAGAGIAAFVKGQDPMPWLYGGGLVTLVLFATGLAAVTRR